MSPLRAIAPVALLYSLRIQELLAIFSVTPRILAAQRCSTSMDKYLIVGLGVIAAFRLLGLTVKI